MRLSHRCTKFGSPVIPEFIIEGDHKLEGGKRALQEIYKLREQPTAVLCSNDMTAIGVMRQAYELGVNVPQELSIIGFDDTKVGGLHDSAAHHGSNVSDGTGHACV